MRAFILLCLFAASCSADKLGYNYQPVGHADEGLSFQPGQASQGQVIGELPQQLLQPVQSGEAVLSQPIEAPLQTGPLAPQIAPLVEEFQKEFYSYGAPEEQFDEVASNQQIANSLKKNLRVVFIRTPENQGFERAALQLAKQSAQQETAIYVLSKQSDVSNLAKQLNALKTSSSNKPEVHFVKYRTPEDAANAQLAIQNQYNQLPGVSRISNEGSAPVLNFASQAVQPAVIPASVAAPAPVSVSAPSSDYLPANVVASQDYLPPTLRRFRLK
ncbi:uncharacterized protein LOC108148472 [Drosophila elegans]|uniref:uncharacterized protein LOC108148472 n=1 Tax=Drosophila elegans TaxID=30023 RepID=UPI0007E78295|nr:uncharacterized protein LOC108148472 [Drosophila elegans]